MLIHATDTLDFTVKYAPRTFADIIIGNPMNQRELGKYVARQTTRPLILYGPNGTGKSTIADLLPEAILGDDASGNVLHLDPFRDGDIGQLQERVSNFAETMAFNFAGLRFVIMDELDLFPKAFIQNVKVSINRYREHVLFVATTNKIDALDRGHLSRSTVLHIDVAPLSAWMSRIKGILKAERAPVPAQPQLQALLDSAKGDHREFLSQLEQYVFKVRSGQPIQPMSKPAAQIVQFKQPLNNAGEVDPQNSERE